MTYITPGAEVLTTHPKPNFVRITPTEITGRRFHILGHVAPDASIDWEPLDRTVADDAVVPEPGIDHDPGAPNVRRG